MPRLDHCAEWVQHNINSRGWNFFFVAVQVEFLRANNFYHDLCLKRQDGCTPLMVAVAANKWEMVIMLVKKYDADAFALANVGIPRVNGI